MRHAAIVVAALSVTAAACTGGGTASSPQPVPSGHDGFVATLGADTVHLEQYATMRDSTGGTIVTRTPALRVTRWTMTHDRAGNPRRYTIETRDAAGVVVPPSGSMTYARDTVVREVLRNGQMETQRIPSRVAAFPSPSLPYIGVSYLMYETALADARRRGDSAVTQLAMLAQQAAPSRTRAWFPAPDSAEISYFGVAKSGYKLDAQGRLLRADWRATTYGYVVRRAANVDVDAAIRAWTAAEQRGVTFGALSPRDTARGTIGAAQIAIDYGRPSRRGRDIWGTVVPWDRVWRLGADMATHMTTSVDLDVGGTTVPAGRYTLWMIPSRTQPMLVVNSAVNVFGTSYNAARDFARIPMTRADGPTPERLTLRVGDDALAIQWADVTWSVPLRVK